ncbi:MAG: hypothetical protein Q9160_002145 [Pyrenula sp. 1 TL-2023]
MQDDNHEIMKAVARSRTNAKPTWSADFIKGKGEGVIVLLHGKKASPPPLPFGDSRLQDSREWAKHTQLPESTALSSGRPLLSLTIADIGAAEDQIETELSSWFYLAERWKALLLIDEADILLERRNHTDIARNGIVSAFLRKMEYFRGILFLTTNRVGQLDKAFVSRVHTVLHYPKINDTQRRRIWEGFFKKLRQETGGQIKIGSAAKRHVLQASETLKVELNGREIRNALQTAIALAEYEATRDKDHQEGDVVVESAHFDRVFAMTRSFGEYLASIRDEDLQSRARHLDLRNDHWTGKETV